MLLLRIVGRYLIAGVFFSLGDELVKHFIKRRKQQRIIKSINNIADDIINLLNSIQNGK